MPRPERAQAAVAAFSGAHECHCRRLEARPEFLRVDWGEARGGGGQGGAGRWLGEWGRGGLRRAMRRAGYFNQGTSTEDRAPFVFPLRS